MEDTDDFEIIDDVNSGSNTISTDQLLAQQESEIAGSNRIRIKFNKNVIIIAGPSGSGKTYLLSELFKYSGYSLENTMFVSPTYANQNPEIHRTFDGCKIVSHGFETASYDSVNDSLIIFDDFGKDLRSNKSFIRMIINKRHRNVCVIALIQHITFLPTVIRDNHEIFFCFKYQSVRAYKALYEDYMNNFFDNYKHFGAFMRRMRGHSFILSDRTNATLATMK